MATDNTQKKEIGQKLLDIYGRLSKDSDKIFKEILRRYEQLVKKCEDPIARKWVIYKYIGYGLLIFILFPYRLQPGGPFKIQPISQQGVRAKVEGQIESVLVKEGDWVKEGDLIVQLSKHDTEKELNVTRASLDEAKANLEGDRAKLMYSKQEAARAEQLYSKEQISTQEFENKQREKDLNHQSFQARTAEVQRLETLVAYYEKNLSYTKIRSSVEGRIATPYMEKKLDRTLKIGDLVASVEDNRRVIAEIEVPEYYIGDVKVGMRVQVATWAYAGGAFKGKVVDIAPVAVNREEASIQQVEADQESHSVRVLNNQNEEIVRVMAEIPNGKSRLRPGMTGFAKINGRWLPLGVVLTKGIIRFFRVEVWSWLP